MSRTSTLPRLARAVAGAAAAITAVVVAAGPAAACGGLVGENGTIQLTRTTTLAAYHDGVEHYVTSFEFTGQGAEVGSIVPLPGVPTAVERGGDWTLQRLEREVAPPVPADALRFAAGAETSATVLLETKIDALEITVLKGGADEVGTWALQHGFFLSPDAPEVLDFYARRSPIFMAARFDADTARELGQNAGDGTPIQVTIPTDRPWVPLRILALGQQPEANVDADVFLLTDDTPRLLAGGPGLTIERSEAASPALLDDLHSDKGTDWVPSNAWFTFLQLGTAASNLDYDLAISTTPARPPSRVDAGIALTGAPAVHPAVSPDLAHDSGTRVWWIAAAVAAAAAAFVVVIATWRAPERES
jgi:hypothetical protein